MAESQNHGFVVERLIIESGKYPRARVDHAYVSEFDIEAADNPDGTGPVSVKTQPLSKKRVELGDAMRVLNRTSPHRIVLPMYVQEPGCKTFRAIVSIDLSAKSLESLLGDLSVDGCRELDRFVRSIPAGPEGQALFSKKAHEIKAGLHKSLETSAYRLHPKIDSKGQRRLQVSVDLGRLLEHAERTSSFGPDAPFESLGLPFSIRSESRSFRKSEIAPDGQPTS